MVINTDVREGIGSVIRLVVIMYIISVVTYIIDCISYIDVILEKFDQAWKGQDGIVVGAKDINDAVQLRQLGVKIMPL